jgi:hypothetical protein
MQHRSFNAGLTGSFHCPAADAHFSLIKTFAAPLNSFCSTTELSRRLERSVAAWLRTH